MNSERIQTIASLIPHNSIVLDVGTDHAYLPITIIKNKISSKCLASDISFNALKSAKNNIAKYKMEENITLYQADGLAGIPNLYNTITISGMGTKTIKNILNNTDINTIIISSNNNYYELRKFMQEKKYKLKKEIICKENNHYYPIMYYEKGKSNLSEKYLQFGISKNKEYFEYLKAKINKIVKHIKSNEKKKFEIQLSYLEELLKEYR